MLLVVYVNDILLIGNNTVRISETKEYLRKHFVTKDKDRPKYLLRIEFAYNKDKMILS